MLGAFTLNEVILPKSKGIAEFLGYYTIYVRALHVTV